MRYKNPDLEGSRLVYKGRRFLIVEIPEQGAVEGLDREFGEYAVFDRLYGGVAATIKRLGEEFTVTTTTIASLRQSCPTLRDCARALYFLIEKEMRYLDR